VKYTLVSRVICVAPGDTNLDRTTLGIHEFVDNQVRLQLFVLAYNLGNFLRQAVLPQAVRHWTLTTLREKLIKIGAKVVRHAQQVVYQMAGAADHKGVASIQRIRFFPSDMFAAPGGDDDNFRELVCVQPKWFLWITAFHRNRKSIRMKPVFPFEGCVCHGG
jgi:hypothetical protein